MAARIGDRTLFPTLEARAYLAHAAVAPLARDVQAAIGEVLELVGALGITAMPTMAEASDRARMAFARLVGVPAGQVARVANTSAGVTAISTGLRLEAGDRIVTFQGEFPTNVRPWMEAARRAGAEVVQVPLTPFLRSHAEGLAAVDAVLDERTVLVAVSAVEFHTGLAMPVAELAKRAHGVGARLFVDAIQAVGAMPIDAPALGVDYLACGGHKWLMGPLGVGYLHVAPAAREELDPQQVGWVGNEEPFIFLNAPNELRYDRPLFADAQAFEQGVFNFAGLAGSAVAMETLSALGPAAIHSHVQAYHDVLEPQVEALGWRSLRSWEPAGRSGILAFDPPAGIVTEDVVVRLGERGVVVTGPDGRLRIAPHWPNSDAEIPFVVETLERATAALR